MNPGDLITVTTRHEVATISAERPEIMLEANDVGIIMWAPVYMFNYLSKGNDMYVLTFIRGVPCWITTSRVVLRQELVDAIG